MSETNLKVPVSKLVKDFNLHRACGDNNSMDGRYIVVCDVNRPGLELSGFQFDTNPRRIIIIGEKEQKYLSTLSDDVVYDRFSELTDVYTPCIIVTHGNPVPNGLIRKANELNFPVFTTELPSYRIIADITAYLDEALASTDSLHGVLMNIFGIGVIITGESGMGKSEVALEMIKRGHLLISDDRVDVARVNNRIVGMAPYLLKGYLEIRGIGIIDVASMFGVTSVSDKSNVDLVVHFEAYDYKREYARVGVEVNLYEDILGMKIPKMTIPVTAGRSMATLLESAVSAFKLKVAGYDSAKSFERKVYDYLVAQDKAKGAL